MGSAGAPAGGLSHKVLGVSMNRKSDPGVKHYQGKASNGHWCYQFGYVDG